MQHRLTDICFSAHSCISCLDRARVVGGLPDVVAIQEGKVSKLDIQCVKLFVSPSSFAFTLSFRGASLPSELCGIQFCMTRIQPLQSPFFSLVPQPDWQCLGRARA